MGKRSSFQRIDKDFYRTIDPRAVPPLLPHIADIRYYDEPCVGAGDLVEQLDRHGKICTGASDIAQGVNALTLGTCRGQAFITNPPWKRPILHALIAHLSRIAPTWLLFDADWMHTDQCAPFLRYCRKIISVGRLLWIPGTTDTGKDNCAWYFFDQANPGATEFFGPLAYGDVPA